jgi:hypothetical protein
MAAEINLATGAANVISQQKLDVLRWDPQSAILTVSQSSRHNDTRPRLGYYRKAETGWTKIPPTQMPTETPTPTLKISEGLNEPWKLVVEDPHTQEKRLVYDPNPDLLTTRKLARETLIHWQTRAGSQWVGGLYWPIDRVEGRRYPLVIQTHGFSPDRFWPDGFSTSGYAAQPLAGAGVFVLQIGGPERMSQTERQPEREGLVAQEGVEAGIDYLAGLGLIDRTKVGLQGFSRSGYHVLYFLTHSNCPLATATVTDSVNYSYVSYLLFPQVINSFNRINGGAPFGSSMQTWLERAPGFNLNHVSAPLLLTALGGVGGLLSAWEPYAGLLAQGKPAELVYIPDAKHEIVRPWERFTSQQGAVDWFRFWLQDYERNEPVAEAVETREDLRKQYDRWHKLREMRDANAADGRH